MSERLVECSITPYGFRYGPIEVRRCFEIDGRVMIEIKPDQGESLTIYASPTGRSLRVYRNHRELREAPLMPRGESEAAE